MRQICRDGSYQSDPPDFMVFLDWKGAALVLERLDNFPWMSILVVAPSRLVAFDLRLLRLPFADQGCISPSSPRR